MKKTIFLFLSLFITLSASAFAFEEVISSPVESPEMARITKAVAPVCKQNCKVQAYSRDGTSTWVANFPCATDANGGCWCNSHGWTIVDDRCIY